MAEKIKLYAQGSLAEYANDGDRFDRYYLPARALVFGARDRSARFVLPDHHSVKTYHSQLQMIFTSLQIPAIDGRATFIPDSDYLLDVAIATHINLLTKDLDRSHIYTVYPYAATTPLFSWLDALKGKGYDITSALPEKNYYNHLGHPENRSGWARSVNNPDLQSFPEKFGIPYPVSYTGQGLQKVLEAYERVVEKTENPSVFFKPVFSAGGFTLKKVSSKKEVVEHYERLAKQGALNILGDETPIEMQQTLDCVAFHSTQYDGERIVSPRVVTTQLIEGTNWKGNVFNNGTDPKIIAQARTIFSSFAYGMRSIRDPLMGWGGIDFGEIREANGQIKLVVIENNAKRITGGHPAIALASGLGIESPYMTQKSPSDPRCDLKTLWNVVSCLGIQFDRQTKTGIFPIVWMEGSGMLLAAAPEADAAMAMLTRTYDELAKRDYLT